MAYLIFVGISIALGIGFFVLTRYEAAQGARVLGARRERLDASVGRVVFIANHVDFNAFARDEARRFVGQLSHALAHLSLQAVRAAERALTRLVRHLRSRRGVEVKPAGETREFVKTLSDFKDRLKDTMPEVPEVHEGE